MRLAALIFATILAEIYSQNQTGNPPPNGQNMGFPATYGLCGTTIQTRNVSYSLFPDDANGTQTGMPGGYRQIISDSCPGYDWTSQSTPNQAKRQSMVVKLPLQPKLSTVKTYIGLKKEDGTTVTTPLLDSVGMAINGVAIYGNSDADLRDAFLFESMSFDKCGGHPQQGGMYHYHEEPGTGCVFNDTAGKHSPLFGFMYDGFPIYGQYGDNGTVPTDLDECGGHVDKTYPFYHYHLPKNKAFPYTLTCLKGCILNSNGNPNLQRGGYILNYTQCRSVMNSTQYDYSSINTVDLIQNYTPNYATSSSEITLPLKIALAILAILII